MSNSLHNSKCVVDKSGVETGDLHNEVHLNAATPTSRRSPPLLMSSMARLACLAAASITLFANPSCLSSEDSPSDPPPTRVEPELTGSLVNYETIDTRTALSSGTSLPFIYEVSYAIAMKFAIAGGTGDADLYVRRGSPPTSTVYDCRPYSSDNNETCEFNPAGGGTYYVMIQAYHPFAGVTLTVSASGAVGLNLAAGKPATQSSTYGGAEAIRAVDGNTDGDNVNQSVSHTTRESQPWWQVDLGKVTSIGEVIIYNRTDCCSERLADFDVLLSNDGSNWQTAASFAGTAPTRTALPIYESGRFVRVRLRGTNYLSLAEVQVYAQQNLAVGKLATQSSTYSGAEAARAVDGNTDGIYANQSVSSTHMQNQPWWQVDLGAVANIREVDIYNRTDCCSERLADFDVLLSNDGSNWQTAASFAGAAPTRTALPISGSGRFVRVQLRGADAYLSLAEVRISGRPNLAAGKLATQSSTYGGAEAIRAVDGNTDGDNVNQSVSHTTLESQPWWQVDLGKVTSIGEVVIYNRTDCCSTRLADFDVLLSNDGSNWQTAASFAGAAQTRTALSISGSGRFVRVRLRGTNHLSLAEVLVFKP